MVNLYGSTEVSGDCTFFDPLQAEREASPPWHPPHAAHAPLPIGWPISNMEVQVGRAAISVDP